MGFSSILEIPESLVSTHPIVGKSHMLTAREDLLEGEEGSLQAVDNEMEGGGAEEEGIGMGMGHAMVTELVVIEGSRIAHFIISDAGNLGM